MKGREFLLTAALVGMSSQANSAVTLVVTVQDSVLAGYTSLLPAGWQQGFTFGVIPPSSVPNSPNDIFYAVNNPYPNSDTTPTTLPPRIGITRIDALGTILTREVIPPEIQVKAADCTLPNKTVLPIQYNGCPYLNASATPLKNYNGRLLVTAYKQIYTVATSSLSYQTSVYVYDPFATLVANKWVLLDARITPIRSGIAAGNFISLNGTYSFADVRSYVFRRPTATSTTINIVQ